MQRVNARWRGAACRKRAGFCKIDVVEVDDIISYHDVVTAEKTLGAKFNIRAFHDAVLELGSVPLPVVTARVYRFITEHGKGPYPDME
jgi:hypothetical protein